MHLDFDPNRPEPIKSINAVEMTLGNVSLPVAEKSAPPVSPPPFIPLHFHGIKMIPPASNVSILIVNNKYDGFIFGQ